MTVAISDSVLNCSVTTRLEYDHYTFIAESFCESILKIDQELWSRNLLKHDKIKGDESSSSKPSIISLYSVHNQVVTSHKLYNN